MFSFYWHSFRELLVMFMVISEDVIGCNSTETQAKVSAFPTDHRIIKDEKQSGGLEQEKAWIV